MPVCFICFKPIQPLSSNVQCSTCILFRHKSCVSDPAIAFVCPGCGEYWKPTDNGLCIDVPTLTPMPVVKTEIKPHKLMGNGVYREVYGEDYSDSTTDVNYMVMPMGSRQGTLLLVDSKGYTYTQKRQSVSTLTFVCSSRSARSRCLARVRQRLITGEYLPGPQPHNHPGDSGIVKMVEKNLEALATNSEALTEHNGLTLLKDPRMALKPGEQKATVLANHLDEELLKMFDVGQLGEVSDELNESSSSAVLDSIEQQNDSLVMVPQTMDELLHGSPNLKFELIPYGSRHGTDLLADSDGYTYTHKRSTNKSSTWICTGRQFRCTAKVTQTTGTSLYRRNLICHNHRPDKKRNAQIFCKMNAVSIISCKEPLKENGSTSGDVSTSISENYDSFNSTFTSDDDASESNIVVQVLDKQSNSPQHNGIPVAYPANNITAEELCSRFDATLDEASSDAVVQVLDGDDRDSNDISNDSLIEWAGSGMDSMTLNISKGRLSTEDAVQQVLNNIKVEHERYLAAHQPITQTELSHEDEIIHADPDHWEVQPPDLKFHIIEGGTKKGGELLVDSDGFTYPLKRDNNRGKTWICSARHKKCPAKVLRLMGSKQFVRNGRKHTHLPNPKSIRFSETCEFLDQEPNGNDPKDDNCISENCTEIKQGKIHRTRKSSQGMKRESTGSSDGKPGKSRKTEPNKKDSTVQGKASVLQDDPVHDPVKVS